MTLQFWRFGMAGVLAASCFVLLLAPLKSPVAGTGFPVEDV